MLFEPIEIELDKPRKFFLSARALMRAEKEVNRQRGAKPSEHVSIDYLTYRAAADFLAGAGNFPLDLVAVLLWAGLNAAAPDKDQLAAVDQAADLLDQSPLPRGRVLTLIWEHYAEVTQRKRSPESEGDSGAQEGQELPLARGSSSGVLQ